MKKTKLIKCLTSVILAYSSIASALPADPNYFVDHQLIAPGKTFSMNYTIPAKEFFLQCNQDSGGALGSIEWQYKDVTYKGQLKLWYIISTLMTDQMPHPEKAAGQAQLANASGTLIVKNLDQDNLYLTCRYSTTLN